MFCQNINNLLFPCEKCNLEKKNVLYPYCIDKSVAFFFSGSPNEEFHAKADIITQCITGNEDCNQQKRWALSPDTSLINLCYLSVIVQITKDALLLLCLCP